MKINVFKVKALLINIYFINTILITIKIKELRKKEFEIAIFDIKKDTLKVNIAISLIST